MTWKPDWPVIIIWVSVIIGALIIWYKILGPIVGYFG